MTYTVSLSLFDVEADDPHDALDKFKQYLGVTPPIGTLFVVTDDEDGHVYEVEEA